MCSTNLVIREMQCKNVTEISFYFRQNVHYQENKEEMLVRLLQERKCYLLFVGGKLMHSIWQ